MWTEASILLMFAAGMTLVYAGLEKLFSGSRRARAALIGVALALVGALTVYAAVSRLLNP